MLVEAEGIWMAYWLRPHWQDPLRLIPSEVMPVKIDAND